MDNLLSRCYHLNQYIADYAIEHPPINALDITLLIEKIQNPQFKFIKTTSPYYCNKCLNNKWAIVGVLKNLQSYTRKICVCHVDYYHAVTKLKRHIRHLLS